MHRANIDTKKIISPFNEKGDANKIKKKLLKTYDDRGAEYPSEHNVGHEYSAKPVLSNFYKKLDPTNSFNPGIGKTSKKKNWLTSYINEAKELINPGVSALG